MQPLHCYFAALAARTVVTVDMWHSYSKEQAMLGSCYGASQLLCYGDRFAYTAVVAQLRA